MTPEMFQLWDYRAGDIAFGVHFVYVVMSFERLVMVKLLSREKPSFHV